MSTREVCRGASTGIDLRFIWKLRQRDDTAEADALGPKPVGQDHVDVEKSPTVLSAATISIATVSLVALLLSESIADHAVVLLFGAILGHAADRTIS